GQSVSGQKTTVRNPSSAAAMANMRANCPPPIKPITLPEGRMLGEGDMLDEADMLGEADMLDEADALDEGDALGEGDMLDEADMLGESRMLEESVILNLSCRRLRDTGCLLLTPIV
ncbi:hypothetical protein Q654_01414, partial [Bartonella henselae JK 50]